MGQADYKTITPPHSLINILDYTAGTAVSMCVTLQGAAQEVSGKC